jgi:hypothetical protein
MQFETLLRFQLTQVTMAFIKNQTTKNAGENVGVRWRTLTHYWWECKLVWPLWASGWRILKTLKVHMTLLYHSWAYDQRNVSWHTIKTSAHPCYLKHYSQYPNYESS